MGSPGRVGCTEPGCVSEHFALGLCRKHYKKDLRRRQKENLDIARRNRNLNEDYEAASRVTELTLIVSEVHSLVNEALLIETFPGTVFPKTMLDVLTEAETLLRSTRRNSTTDER